MRDYATAQAERATRLADIRNRRQQLEHTFKILSEIIREPSSHPVGGQTMNMQQMLERQEQSRIKREDLRLELEGLREAEDRLLREEQAEAAQQQWESTRASQKASNLAAWIGVGAAIFGVAAAFYNAYLIQHQPAPICSPAKVETRVEAPPAPPAPDVTVVLDSRTLPIRKTTAPRKRKP
jgi:hypothetical protein